MFINMYLADTYNYIAYSCRLAVPGIWSRIRGWCRVLTTSCYKMYPWRYLTKFLTQVYDYLVRCYRRSRHFLKEINMKTMYRQNLWLAANSVHHESHYRLYLHRHASRIFQDEIKRKTIFQERRRKAGRREMDALVEVVGRFYSGSTNLFLVLVLCYRLNRMILSVLLLFYANIMYEAALRKSNFISMAVQHDASYPNRTRYDYIQPRNPSNSPEPEEQAENQGLPEGQAENQGLPEGQAENQGLPEGQAENQGLPEVQAENQGLPEGQAENQGLQDGQTENSSH